LMPGKAKLSARCGKFLSDEKARQALFILLA